MKKTLKYYAALLIISLLCPILQPCLSIASQPTKAKQNLAIEQKDVVYVDDGDGNRIPVEIIETIYISSDKSITANDYSPKRKIGERRTYSVKISNNDMGVPSAVGGALSLAAKRKAAQIAGKAIAAKLGSNFIPGVNFVSWALGTAALINAYTGKSGIIITVNSKYVKSYYHKGGYYVYGWSPTSISIRRY